MHLYVYKCFRLFRQSNRNDDQFEFVGCCIILARVIGVFFLLSSIPKKIYGLASKSLLSAQQINMSTNCRFSSLFRLLLLTFQLRFECSCFFFNLKNDWDFFLFSESIFVNFFTI